VLANPTLKFTGDRARDEAVSFATPRLVPRDQLALVGRYSGVVILPSRSKAPSTGRHRKFTYEVDFPHRGDEHEFIPRLWATRRVGYLLDEIRLHGENAELKDEITELARKYGIVTPYTAYLIVEDEDRRGVPAPMQTLRRLSEDQFARREAAANWSFFRSDRSGARALAGARHGNVLKMADAPSEAAAGGSLEANRALGVTVPPSATAAPSADSKVRLVQYSQQGQFISGKNFFPNTSNQWVDAAAQKFQNAKKQRIQFNSADYFAFAAKNSKALPWLALARTCSSKWMERFTRSTSDPLKGKL